MPWLPENISLLGGKVDFLFYVVLAITGAVFVLVEVTLLAFLVLYRRREGRAAAYTHGNHTVEVIWTLVPAAILVVLAILSQRTLSEMHSPAAYAGEPLEVEVTAEQFAWNVKYAQSGVTALNRMRIPVNRPIRVALGSKDVIHSFFLPNLRLKQDTLPGMKTSVMFEAIKTGTYDIACAEFCGLAHYRMRGYLTVLEPAEFDAWLAGEIQAMQPPAPPSAPLEPPPAAAPPAEAPAPSAPSAPVPAPA